MLWYKSWLETRWRFVGGVVLLMLSAGSTVALYPQVLALLPAAANLGLEGELGRRVAESAELARSYRGYVWSQWFRQNMPQLWTLVAAALGTGGLLSQAAGGGALFTLSLPVSRARLVSVRAATVIGELLVLSLIPAVIFPLLSPVVGQSYGFADAAVHGVCMFVGGAVFFSLAFFLSTIFGDIWRPLLLAVCVAFAGRTGRTTQCGHQSERHFPGDERRVVLPRRRCALVGSCRQRGVGGGDGVRGNTSYRAPGFLTRKEVIPCLQWPRCSCSRWRSSSRPSIRPVTGSVSSDCRR